MIKKFASFLYCLAPLCATADVIPIHGTPGEVSQFSGNLNATSDSYVASSGAGLNVTGGITTVDGLYVGVTPTTPNVGAVYAESGIDADYVITTGGDISIGTMLQVLASKNLTIGGASDAVNITTGAVEVAGGLTITNAGALSFAQFVGSGSGTANISGTSLNITTGDFQAYGSKAVTLNLGTGAFNVANGAIENKSSGNMTITAGAITAQTITNEAETGGTGSLAINASSLNLTGGDATDNASFVLSGNFNGTISGATTLAHGFDLSGLGATNTFYLETGTLTLNDRIGAFYTNNLSLFTLILTDTTNGNIDAGTYAIRNGTSNSSAYMVLDAAKNVTGGGIENVATMNITAGNTVTMTGDVVNSGTLTASATSFSLQNINNTGTATFNGTGAFSAGAIENATGATSLTVTGSTVTATGLITNNAGTMTVTSGGALSALGLAADAGTMNISGTALNIGTSGIDVATNGKLNTTGNIVSGGEISVANNLTAGAASTGAGDMAVSNGIVNITVNNNDKLSVGNNVTATGSGKGISIDAHTMEIGGDVAATNSGSLTFGVASGTDYVFSAEGDLSATSGGKIYLYTDNAFVSGAITENSGLIVTDDTNVTAGSVGINGGLWYDGDTHTSGFVINSGNTFTLNTDMAVISGGGNVASGNTLNILRVGNQMPLTMSGSFANAGTVNIGSAERNYGAVTLGALTNSGDFNVWTNQIAGGNIINNSGADLNLVSTGNVSLTNLNNSGAADVSGTALSLGTVTAASGNATGGGLRVVGTTSIAASSLNITGGAGAMDITAPVINIAGAVNTNGGVLHQGSGSASSLNLLADEFTFNAASWTLGSFVADGGIGTYTITGDANFGDGIVAADGALVHFNRDVIDAPLFDAVGDLVQNGSDLAQDGTVNMMSDSFTLNANTVVVGGDINVNDFTIANLNATNGVNIDVTGNVSGGLDVIGLERMHVGVNYIFDNNSKVLAIANTESETYNYWTDVDFSGAEPVVNELTGDETALITVGRSLISQTSGLNMTDTPADLADGQFGIVLKQAVTESTALWLAHATEIQGTFSKLMVGFCNDDGTQCVNYLDAFSSYNGTDENLPVYLVTQGNDLYVVFDDRFGDPIGLYKLQPIVGATPGHTLGEWQSAGALDDVIEAALANNGFTYETAILPVVENIFAGTPLENVDSELYARMYDYHLNGNGNVIRNFSRLFQLREANQIADSLSLNTHTNFRDMSDRFIDEAIWNRNRRLNKLWVDGGYGMFTNDFEDIKGDGNRFNLALGYDWQSSNTLILGWMLHGSYTDANVVDDIDLSYTNSGPVAGRMESDVTNLSVGGGLYFLNTLSNKARLYGDLMFDVNMIDVERNQTWVDTIKGDATSFGIVGELGLIHDWLNQYIIGNLYARAGYNFGFDMTEKVGDSDYMNLKFDGHPILTPGYSLVAQKRVYPSVWFEFRPYLTVGVEYDLLGSPDTMKYKFAMANKWTEYDIEIDPLWANAGAGVEFLSVNGLHVGLGYRYNYNADVQMHKVHASIKYRF